MVQWQSINPNLFNTQIYQFGSQQGYIANNFTPMFPAQTFIPSTSAGFCGGYDFMVHPNPFWGSKFGNFLAGMLGLKIQQPAINSSHIYQNMGLNLTNTQQVQGSRTSQGGVPVQQATQDAVKTIMDNFDSLGLPEEAKNYLANIEYSREPFGAARADIQNGKIIVNTANAEANTTDMVKVLIHESLHCVNKSAFSSREEEFNCEKQAIQITSKLINDGKLDDFQIYNHSMKELGSNERLLDSSLQGWLDSGGYNNRILDSKGNVNIEQYEIHSGDTILINGKEHGKIGEHFLEGMQSSSICQLFSVSSENRPNTSGIVVFDNTTYTTEQEQRFLQQKNNPQKIEIVRNGEIICTGTIYNYRDNF